MPASVAARIRAGMPAGYQFMDPLSIPAETDVIDLVAIADPRTPWPRQMRDITSPTVLLIGDDPGSPNGLGGPDAWRCSHKIGQWAQAAIVHGSGGDAQHYRFAVTAALTFRRVVFIESTARHALSLGGPDRLPAHPDDPAARWLASCRKQGGCALTVSHSAADVARRLDLKKGLRSWRGKCPACDYAGTFSLKAGRDDRPLLYCANGCTYQQLDDELARRLGDGWKPELKPEGTPEQDAAARAAKSAKAVAIFNGSTVLTASDPAGRYLASRYLAHLIGSPALRFRGDAYHPEGGRYPALVAIVHDPAGLPVACHRTYLTQAGCKAVAEPAKASKGPVWGAAIRLYRAGPEIVVGEGIEIRRQRRAADAAAGLGSDQRGQPCAWASPAAPGARRDNRCGSRPGRRACGT